MLVFVRRKLPVPMWQVIVPIAALVVLGYTLYRNVIPYPTGAARVVPGSVWRLAASGRRGRNRRPGHGAQAGRRWPPARASRRRAPRTHRPASARGRTGRGLLNRVADLLHCVAEQALVDHHCHGVLPGTRTRPRSSRC